MKKRLVSLLLAFSMMLTFLPVGAIQAFAEENPTLVYTYREDLTKPGGSNGHYIYKLYSLGIKDYAVLNEYETYNETEVNIPDAIEYNGSSYVVTEIGANAFGNTHSFSQNKYTKITLPDTIEKIGENAFKNCTNLATVNFPESLTTIGKNAFNNTALTDIMLPKSLTYIGWGAFSECAQLAKAVFSDDAANNVLEMDEYVFWRCKKLSSVELPSQLKKLSPYTFYECDTLKSVDLPKQLETIGGKAFANSGIEEITIPGTVKSIENISNLNESGAFDECTSLKKVVIEEGTEALSIARQAFYGCSNLTNVELPHRVSSIGENAFNQCIKLSGIYYNGFDTEWANNVTAANSTEDKTALKYVSPSNNILIYYNCLVTFKADENAEENLAQVTVRRADRIAEASRPDNPTKVGYDFAGWYVNGTQTKFDVSSRINKSMTLVAHWTAKPHTAATVTINGITDNTTVKAGETLPFTVAAVANDDTDANVTFELSNDKTHVKYRDSETDSWKDIPEGGLSIGEVSNKKFQIIVDADAEDAQNVTLTVTAKNGNTAIENATDSKTFAVSKHENAIVTITGLDKNSELTEGMGHEFTVSADLKDDGDIGNLTFTVGTDDKLEYWDDTKNDWAPVPDAGLPITGGKGDYKLKLTPGKAGNDSLTATVTPDGKTGVDAKVDFTVKAKEVDKAEVDIVWKDNNEVKPGESKDFTVKVTPNGDGEGTIDFGDDNKNIEYKEIDDDGNETWKPMPDGGLNIDMKKDTEASYDFRITPPEGTDTGDKTLTATVKKDDGTELGKDDSNYTVAKKDDGGNENPNPNPGGDSGNTGGNGGETPNPNPGGGESGGDNENPKPNPGDNTGDNTETDETKNWETITVEDGSITKVLDKDGNDITEKVTATKTVDETSKTKLIYKAPAGAKVTVKANDAPENMKFKMWVFSVANMNGDPDNDVYSSEMTFTVPKDGVIVSAMYESADIDDGGYEIIGPIVIGGTIVAGSAALGYQTYSLVTDFLGSLYGLPYFPSNRSALALMLWEDAGKPEPESDILYPDVGWEEQDMDLQHAARWAMEHELLPDKNDKDADLAPEEVKFFPNDMITKASVLKAWMKALELKKNA